MKRLNSMPQQLRTIQGGAVTFACKSSWQDWQDWYIYTLNSSFTDQLMVFTARGTIKPFQTESYIIPFTWDFYPQIALLWPASGNNTWLLQKPVIMAPQWREASSSLRPLTSSEYSMNVSIQRSFYHTQHYTWSPYYITPSIPFTPN